MRVEFWGTRGSIAKPGPATARYGGNTSCVEVRSDAGTLIVIDCGTGGHALGQHLAKQANGAVDGHLLISHTHWDHIQGIPFFAPLFVAGNTWEIYGPKGLSQSLRATLAGQMEHTYFPITLDQFAAKTHYHDLVEGAFSIGEVNVITRYLNHPALTLGYRLEVDGASVAYCCDHEPHSVGLASGEAALTGMDRRYADFVAGADLVIHDTQYTASEYASKIGWGHSPVEYAVRVCRDAGVKRLALTHYDPLREDDAVDRILEEIRGRLRSDGSPLEVLAAAEGLALRVNGAPRLAAVQAKHHFQAKTAIDVSAVTRPVLLLLADREMTARLTEALAIEGLPHRAFAAGEDLLRAARADHPSLVMVEHNPPRIDGIEIARAIRRSEPTGGVQVPVVLVSAVDQPANHQHGSVTDWLVAPFSLNYARTRIRAWVLRAASRWIRARLPADEGRRLAALRELSILDTPAEARFDRVTRLAAAALDVPIALVSLVDKDRQWFKSCFGLNARETPREVAFCAHVVHQREELIVPDTLLDDRFADNPLVLEEPRIRFYAGAPLMVEDGSCIGTLCVIDTRPRELSATDLATLRDLRDLALEEIERTSATGKTD
jgi:phosphoribosyl 1,2-cyclic phosphodiesterase/DNA-binding response OmpR family regulator